MDSLRKFRLLKSKAKLSSLLGSSATPSTTTTTTTATQPSFYVLATVERTSDKTETIWFNRLNSDVILKYSKAEDLKDLEEIAIVYGYIGRFQINSSYNSKLLFIKSCETIGKIRVKSIEHSVFKIKEILLVNLSPATDFESESLAHVECDIVSLSNLSHSESNAEFYIPVTPNKKVDDQLDPHDSPKLSTSFSSPSMNNESQMSPSPNRQKFEKKIVDEILKIFQENNGSFYFSPTFDLTNSVERQEERIQLEKLDSEMLHDYKNAANLWRKSDDRFFWNKVLLKDLVEPSLGQKSESEDDKAVQETLDELADVFVLPLIQGFVQTESFLSADQDEGLSTSYSTEQLETDNKLAYRLCLISRRSRFRLGTRFKRRGVDENGNVANFVETEQIIDVYDGHTLSFVIIRGSIPVFWSQPGIKYRPAPIIEKNASENKAAFQKHMKQIEESYLNKIAVINLVEETGRESILGDAFLEQVADSDSPNLTYVQFDFHEYCKGLNYQNITKLTEKIEHLITGRFYTWVDNKGFIFKQDKIIRVNCVDCLDRTNVVQTVISKIALENQLAHLGFIIPPANLPADLNKMVSLLWADNGDAISQQYAGTSALKGDFTRTGERNLLHAMKDGMKSANRYYLRFKDNNRQLAFQVLQGFEVEDDSNMQNSLRKSNSASNLKAEDDLTQLEREQNVRQLVVDCRKQLISDSEDLYGSWALINFNESADLSAVDPDVFLLFTSSALYVSNYNEANETFTDYQEIPLQDIERLELAPESGSTQIEQLLFKSANVPRFHVLRIHYKHPTGSSATGTEYSSGYFHTFRSCNLRLFNNLVITMKSQDEHEEALRGLCHTIQSTAAFFNISIEFEELPKLPKKRTRVPNNFISLSRFSTRMSIDQGSFKDLKNFNNNGKTTFNKLRNFIGASFFGKTKAIENQPQASIPESLESTTSTNQPSTIDSFFQTNNQMAADSLTHQGAYVPELSRNQYVVRQDKLNDIQRFVVKDSKTQVIII